jgi:hypothetical protein
LPTGGWNDYLNEDGNADYPGVNDPTGENNEITGEALWALYVDQIQAPATLSLDVAPTTLYVQPGYSVTVSLNVSNLAQQVAACQSIIGYSSSFLTVTRVVDGGSPWNDPLFTQLTVIGDSGEIDSAVGVYAQTTSGTAADGTILLMTFTAQRQGHTQLVFLPDTSDVHNTMLADMNGNPIYPQKNDSLDIVIDGVAPSVALVSATEGDGNLITDGNNAIQGPVTLAVAASDNVGGSGLAGRPMVTVVDAGGTSLTVSNAGVDGMGNFLYTVTITPTTANGPATITANVSDLAGNAAAPATARFAVNKNQITGQVQSQGFVGTGAAFNHSLPVTFVITTATGVQSTVTQTLSNAGGDTFNYTLTNVSNGVTTVSAKTAWTLRRRLAASLDTNGQVVGLNFIGNAMLLGGDLDGSNLVNVSDYTILEVNWLTAAPAANITGSGIVNILDYTILKLNWLVSGDPQ